MNVTVKDAFRILFSTIFRWPIKMHLHNVVLNIVKERKERSCETCVDHDYCHPLNGSVRFKCNTFNKNEERIFEAWRGK